MKAEEQNEHDVRDDIKVSVGLNCRGCGVRMSGSFRYTDEQWLVPQLCPGCKERRQKSKQLSS